MTVTLVKCSAPGWSRDFACVSEAVAELREHICGDCLDGGEFDSPLDFEHEGRSFRCHDAGMLLGTSCGLEFNIEGDHGLWPAGEDVDGSAWLRPRRKITGAQMIALQG